MRFFAILFFFASLSIFGQTNSNSKKIDSLRNVLLKHNFTDSIQIANVNYELGQQYRFSFLGDSAYYHYNNAEKVFRKLGNKLSRAKTLYGIAVVQKNEKDFTGSEVTSIESLKLLNQLEKTDNVKRYISYVYNNLGLLFGELEQFEESISYHEEAIKLKREYGDIDSYNISVSKNNLALSFKKSGSYSLAKAYYAEILQNNSLYHKNPSFYALVLDNYAHTKYLQGDKEELPALYFKALSIADSINPNGSYNSIIINQHLAQYYYERRRIDSAKYYAYKARNIAENYSKDELLTSMLLLSEVEDGEVAAKHLKDYVKLNDSLQKEERKIRNKFARIRFETDQIEKENIKMAKERLWLLIISTVLIIASFLLYLVIRQRIKNKELQFIQQQQEANEEIYNLMLSQNDSIEEARTLEKRRISEELHDGVLGRLFGTRLSLDSLNMANSADAVKTRGEYIEALKSIEEDIRKVSHELNTDFVAGAGFRDIIKTLIETQSSAYKIQFKFTHDDSINWDAIPNKNKIHIYRIIQETLNNIYKHANATLINISFKLKKNVICLVMKDDGSGFHVNRARSGIGLKNMKSRIKEIKGALNITSKIGVGTKVRIEVPVTETTTNV